MTISIILASKGREVVTIDGSPSVLDCPHVQRRS
jgi:hypothetical protein